MKAFPARIAVLIAAVLLLMGTVGAAASDKLPITEASDGVKLSGQVSLISGQYLIFRNVDFTNVAAVTITGTPTWTSHWNGDTFELRIDKPKGKVIGYVDFDEEGEHEFFCNVDVTGTHDLYVISTYGVAGSSKITSVGVSASAFPEKPAYEPVPDGAVIDSFSDTWAATSGLGRKVADFDEVGEPDPEKQVGLFYWIWNTNEDTTQYVINNSTFQKEHPEAYLESGYQDPAWPTGSTVYFLDEPVYGYYAGNDYWVYRKDAEILADAGVDFLFLDDTNGRGYFRRNMQVFCSALRDAKLSGVRAPKFTIVSNMSHPVENTKFMLENLYLTFYNKGLYSDLWYYWDGKPLIMAHPESLDEFIDMNDTEDIALTDAIENFFTFRGVGGVTDLDQKWSIGNLYPQETVGGGEAVVVDGAMNKSIETGKLTPMSTPTCRNKTYTETFGHDYTPGAHLYNYFFEEQMAGALRHRGTAKVLLISSWNEWTAVRNENYNGLFRNSFVDHFDDVNTRDLAISKGTNRDNGYLLLCDAIRKWKGVRPTPAASPACVIDMANPASWDAVAPTYYNTKGAYERHAKSYAGLTYDNTSARNNIRTAKAAHSADTVWFTAAAEKPLTGEATDNFMVLYINADRNHATGWEGYDYRIRKNAVERFDGAWTACGSATYVVTGERIQIAVAKETLGISAIDFEFKWVDNSDDSDILNFYTEGIAAPTGRFNYVYTEKAPTSLTMADRRALSGCTVIKMGKNRAVIRGGIMPTFEADTRYGVRDFAGVPYMPGAMLKDAIGYGTTKITFEADRNFVKIDTALGMGYTTVGSNAAVFEGRDITITNPVTVVDGIPYIPVTLLSEMFGYTVTDLSGGAFAFGETIPAEAAKAASEL